jgi:hypothetical protein
VLPGCLSTRQREGARSPPAAPAARAAPSCKCLGSCCRWCISAAGAGSAVSAAGAVRAVSAAGGSCLLSLWVQIRCCSCFPLSCRRGCYASAGAAGVAGYCCCWHSAAGDLSAVTTATVVLHRLSSQLLVTRLLLETAGSRLSDQARPRVAVSATAGNTAVI